MGPQNFHEERVKAAAKAKIKQEYAYFLSLYAQLVMDEVQSNWKKEQLQKKIDQALEKGDRRTFYQLAEDYRLLVR